MLSVDSEPMLARSGVKLYTLGGYEIRVADRRLGSQGESPEKYAQTCQAGDWMEVAQATFRILYVAYPAL